MKTKLTTIFICCLMAINCRAPEKPKMTFVEGVCAGVVVGLMAGAAIYVVFRCASILPPLPAPETNAPPFEPPPALTNNPATNNPPTGKIPVLETGPSGQSFALGHGLTGFLTTLQGSDDLDRWSDVATIQGWSDGTNSQWVAWNTNGMMLAAGATLFLQSSNRFYRTVRTYAH